MRLDVPVPNEEPVVAVYDLDHLRSMYNKQLVPHVLDLRSWSPNWEEFTTRRREREADCSL